MLPKQHHPSPRVWLIVLAFTLLVQVTTQLNITFFLLYSSLSVLMILASSNRKIQEKWLKKTPSLVI